jgi:hypothetical protein
LLSVPDHVFISYKHTPEDSAYVERLSAFLRENGVPSWFDAEIAVGDEWPVLLQDMIEACSALVVVMTPEGARNKWVNREVQEAEDLNKPIMPLLLRGRPFLRLNDIQYEDVRGGHLPRGADFLARLKRLHPPAPAPDPAPKFPEPPLLRLGRRLTAGEPGRAFSQVQPVFLADATAPADTAIDGGSFGDLEIRAASVRGVSHRYDGSPRQDAFAIGADRSGRWLVVAVADGNGGASLSHFSSELVVRRAASLVPGLLTERPPEELDWHGIFVNLADEVSLLGKRHLPGGDERAVIDHMGTAALIAAYQVTPVNAERRLVVARIGDPAAWRLNSIGRWQNVTPFDDNRFLRLPPVALPRVPDEVEVRRQVIPASDTVVLVSEGVGDPLELGGDEVGRFLSDAWRRPPELLEFAEQVAFGRKTFTDDRTAVAIWPQRREER